jgi:hypothetical protein
MQNACQTAALAALDDDAQLLGPPFAISAAHAPANVVDREERPESLLQLVDV